MACTSCGIYTQLDQLATTYAQQAFQALAPSCSRLFGAFATLWLVWQIGINTVLKKQFNHELFFKTLLTFMIIQLFLSGSGFYWEYFYIPFKTTTLNIAQTLISTSGQVSGTDISSMLQAVESELERIFELQRLLAADTSWYQVINYIGGYILIIPFVFVWGIFLAYTLEGIFKLLAVTALAPLFIICVGFESTRSFTIMAARVVLNGCLTVIFAAVAMGFTIAVLRHYIQTLPMDAGGMAQGASTWLFSKDYWSLFLIGFISVLFHLKASTMASNISGAADGPGAAGAVVGGVMLAAHMARQGAMSAGRKVGGWGVQGFDLATKHTKTGTYAFQKPRS